MDLIKVTEKLRKKQQEEHTEYHLHKPDRIGASNLLGCGYLSALKRAGVKLPPRYGIKKSTGAMEVGTILHEVYQDMLVKEWGNEPLPFELFERDDVYFAPEVFVEGKCGPFIVESPIDLAFVTAPGFIKKEIQFKNIKSMEWVKHPDAEWVEIYDIKSAGDYGYKHYHPFNRKSMNWNYKAQFNFYMRATDLYDLTVLFISKSTLQTYERYVHRDDFFWEKVEHHQHRIAKLEKMIREEGMEQMESKLAMADFACKPSHGIEWYSCPLSVTTEKKSQPIKMKLERLCSSQRRVASNQQSRLNYM